LAAVCAISAWETGWLHDGRGFMVNANNIVGISYGSENGGVQQPFRFDSVDCCLGYFRRLMENRHGPNYSSAFRVRDVGAAFIEAVSRAGYNEAASWRAGVKACYSDLVAAGV
jgi:hypothetical protein